MLSLKLDYPSKQKFIKFDEKTTFGQLKNEVAKSFEIKMDDVERHEFRAVAFGQNVLEIGTKGDKSTLSSEGVKSKSLIVVCAPNDLKPVVERKGKKKGKDDDDDGDSKDKYSGYKVETAIKQWETSKGKDEKIALEFIDINLAAVLKTPEFLKLDKKRIVEICKRNTLNIKEGDLFEGVVTWAKGECKRTNLDSSPESLRKVLDEILPLIRFPAMAMEEVATKVTPTSVLQSDQMLQIFTYLGSSKDKQKTIKMPYPTKPREGRRPPNWFSWSTNHKHHSVQLLDKNSVIVSTDPNYWQSVGADIELKTGVHEWEVVLNQYDTGNSYNVVIGCVPSHFNQWTSSTWIGSSTTAPGWAFVTGNGYKTGTNTGQTYYGTAARQGDTVRTRLDLDKRTIEFFVNNTSQGVAFTDVYGPVRPAISLIRSQRVTLQFPK